MTASKRAREQASERASSQTAAVRRRRSAVVLLSQDARRAADGKRRSGRIAGALSDLDSTRLPPTLVRHSTTIAAAVGPLDATIARARFLSSLVSSTAAACTINSSRPATPPNFLTVAA